jgi:deoxyribonuclease-4
MVMPYKNVTACIDFGHVNTFTMGGLKNKDDFKRIIDMTFEELGEEKAKNIHIHFSKIAFGKSGEIKHLTFEDTQFGPDYIPLAELINDYKMTPTIICESDGTMAEDALLIKRALESRG